MQIILDVNPLLAALIKDSTSREIISNEEFTFFFPEIGLRKIRKYKVYIKKKAQLSEEEFLSLWQHILQYITLIPDEQILTQWKKAKEIMEHIDPEDVPFIAAALAHNKPIWSDDKHFKQQNTIKTFNTKELIQLTTKN